MPIHQCALVAMGVHLLDNLRLDRLSAGVRARAALVISVHGCAAASRTRDGFAGESDCDALSGMPFEHTVCVDESDG